MPVTNLLKPQVDQPVFEWLRFSPTNNAASNAFVGLNGQTGERYFYYITTGVNYKYDTYSDSWLEFAPCHSAPQTTIKGQSTKSYGHRGQVISATSTTLQIGGCGYATKAAVGMKIRIMSGVGAGQERTITDVANPVIHDEGISTNTTVGGVFDTTKKWRFNQWDGYSVRVQHNQINTNIQQIRRILYNGQTNLVVSNTDFQLNDPNNNTSFNSNAPFSAPSNTSIYSIESVTLTVNSSWTVQPDASSMFMILSGGVWVISPVSGQSILPQFYDVLADTWIIKTGMASSTYFVTPSNLSNYPFAAIDEASGALVSGVTATSATAKGLVNTGATMEVDRYANHQVRIVSGTGIGQQRRIVGHGATFMHIERNWDITPDSTSGYEIWGDTDKIYMSGQQTSAIFQYSIDADLWATGQIVDYGLARQISATPYAGTTYGAPHQGYGVSSIVRVTTGILSGAVNAAGTNYVVGDLVTCSTTGTNGTFFVTAVNGSGGVTALQLAASGSGYANGSSNTTGGSGSGLTITLTVGTTALVTCPFIHDYRTGDQVTIAGCATDTSFNAFFTILGVGSATTFSIAAPSSSASPTPANSQSSTVLVDATKNWTTNEHTGKLLYIYGTGTAPSLIASRRITSNTATTITVTGAITTPTDGSSRYVICEPHALGAFVTSKVNSKKPTGWATSGTATTLVDSTKTWDNNQWQACRVRIVAGTGLGNESAITSNTATTLTVASWGVATPDATSKYEIMDSYGIVTTGQTGFITDSAKKFPTNIFIAKRARIVAGTVFGHEATISANTATQITVGSSTTDTTSYYVVYEPQLFGQSMERLDWLSNLSDSTRKARYLITTGTATSTTPLFFNMYDITRNEWDIGIFSSPSGFGAGTGTMYAYDNLDSYYFTIAATGRIYRLNIPTMFVEAAGLTPYVHSTAVSRSGMQVLTTEDGLKYLYIQRHSGQEMWRTLKFWTS